MQSTSAMCYHVEGIHFMQAQINQVSFEEHTTRVIRCLFQCCVLLKNKIKRILAKTKHVYVVRQSPTYLTRMRNSHINAQNGTCTLHGCQVSLCRHYQALLIVNTFSTHSLRCTVVVIDLCDLETANRILQSDWSRQIFGGEYHFRCQHDTRIPI